MDAFVKPHIKLEPSKKTASIIFMVSKEGLSLEERQRNSKLVRWLNSLGYCAPKWKKKITKTSTSLTVKLKLTQRTGDF